MKHPTPGWVRIMTRLKRTYLEKNNPDLFYKMGGDNLVANYNDNNPDFLARCISDWCVFTNRTAIRLCFETMIISEPGRVFIVHLYPHDQRHVLASNMEEFLKSFQEAAANYKADRTPGELPL